MTRTLNFPVLQKKGWPGNKDNITPFYQNFPHITYLLQSTKSNELIFFPYTAAGGCHSISKKRELEKAVAEIGDWETLCGNLGVPKAVLNELRSSSMENGIKKSRCLEAYLNTGDTCWEEVVEVVADYPFYNKKLARKIATDHGVDYSSVIKDEL